MEKDCILKDKPVSLAGRIYFSLKSKNVFFIVSMCLFVLLSLIKIFFHAPWYDEVLAYNMAHDLNFFELMSLMKYEGHLFLWHLLLMPFAKLNISHYFALEFLSFGCILSALLLMWRFAPFNDIEKFFISISSHIIFYASYSRCYALSILLLFAIFALYSRRFNRPYFYSLLLIVSANTSLVALFGTTILGLCFLQDMYKAYRDKIFSKKNIIVMFSMFIPAGLLILYQLVNPDMSAKELGWIQNTNLIRNFLDAMFHADFSIHYTVQLAYFILFAAFPLFCFKNFKPLIFTYGSTFALCALFMFVYPPQPWHFCFLFIYLVLGFWFVKLEVKEFANFQKAFLVFFAVYLWLCTLMPLNLKNARFVEFSKYILENQAVFEGSKNYIFKKDSFMQEIMPQIYRTKVKFIDAMGYPVTSLEHYQKQAYEPYAGINVDEIFFKNKDIDTYIFIEAFDLPIFSEALQAASHRGVFLLDKVATAGWVIIFKVVKQ